MNRLLDIDVLSQLRRGADPFTISSTDPERGALFAGKRSLRSMRVVVDRTILGAADHTSPDAFLLGLLQAWEPRTSPTTPTIHSFWYADEGPPDATPRKSIPHSGDSFVPGWAEVRWSDHDQCQTVRYAIGKTVTDALLDIPTGYLEAVANGPLPRPYRGLSDALAQMRADVVAAHAAAALHADVYVTHRETLFSNPSAKPVDTLVLPPQEALSLVGLYWRMQGRFITNVSIGGRRVAQCSEESFYVRAARALAPALDHLNVLITDSDKTGAEAWLQGMALTLQQRLARAIRVRDRLYAALLRPRHANQIEAVAEFDHLNLLLMAAFDVAARMAHQALRLDADIRWAGWQYSRWLDRVRQRDNELSALVRSETPGANLLRILLAFRNTIHSVILPVGRVRENGQPEEIYLALPREEAPALLEAMDVLSARKSWGIAEDYFDSSPETFARLAPLTDTLVVQSVNTLNTIVNAMLVHLPTKPEPESDQLISQTRGISDEGANDRERFLWQLGFEI